MADRADKTSIEIAHFFLINKKRAPKAPQNTAKANAAVYHALEILLAVLLEVPQSFRL